MTRSEPARHVAEALIALSVERWPVTRARGRIRPVPGLYAIYGDAEAWADLGLDPQPGSALYIGKSEDDLVRRELDSHFAADPTKKPRTGSSTVRRSFAALLRDALDLQAVPRNSDNPGHFSNYGLTPEGDARLTTWMHERLSLAVWERPAGFVQPLVEVEVAIIHRWVPPLNIRDNPRPLPRLRLAREAMTREASSAQAREASAATVHPPRESVPTPVARACGLTPVQLAGELGKSPKTIRQALRDKYGKLSVVGDRWGALTPEQESYVRAHFR
ncbi:GIY-YIG nuclease family protein [Arthrobacter sp. USHLN218]|uniref:GIY-YIG nuclease family protein n=1 Tax=Arthrobacter sp. USHLN218 TaxID=3081232 RepID=UPI00301A2554